MAGLLLLIVVPLPMGVQGSSETGDWIVSDHVVIRNETRTLSGNLHIENGGALVLDNVDFGFDRNVEEGQLLRVLAGGELVLLNGTRLHGVNRTYNFVVDGNLTIRGAEGRPVQIQNVRGLSGGGYPGQEAVAADGLVIQGNATMDGFEWSQSRGTILAEDATKVELSNCVVSQSTHVPVVFASVKEGRIDGCRIDGIVTGMFISRSDVVIEDSRLSGGGVGFALSAKDSQVHLRNVELWNGSFSLRAKDGSDIVVEGSLFTNYTSGGIVTPEEGVGAPVDLEIRSTRFLPASKSAATAVWAQSLGQGLFEDNIAGLHGDSGFSFGPATDGLVVRNNTLYRNGRYGLVFSNVEPVLEDNHFGTGNLSNLVGQAYWFRDLRLRVEDNLTGQPLSHVTLNVSYTVPGFGGGFVTKTPGETQTGELGEGGFQRAPRRAILNDGTDLLLPYTFRLEKAGYEAAEVKITPPEDPLDLLILKLDPLEDLEALSDGDADSDGGLVPAGTGEGLALVGAVAALAGVMWVYRRRAG